MTPGQVDEIVVKLLAESTQYLKAMSQADQATRQVSRNMDTAVTHMHRQSTQIEQTTGNIVSYVTQLAGVTATLGTVFKAVQLAGEMEQLEISFRVLTGSAQVAKKTLKELQVFSAQTPFQSPEVIAAAKQMMAFGQTAESIVPTMKMLGDVSVGLQIPLGSLTYLFGTLKAQGRAMTVDINQFAMRGIPIWKELEKQFKKTNAQVRKMVENGEVGFAQVEAAFKSMTKAGGLFNGVMEQQSEGLFGLFSTFKENVEMALRDIGNEIIKFGKLKENLKFWTDLAGDFSAFIKGLSEGTKEWIGWGVKWALIVGGVGVAFSTIKWIVPWLWGLATGPLFQILGILKTMTIQTGALAAATFTGIAPLATMLITITALAAAAALFYAWWSRAGNVTFDNESMKQAAELTKQNVAADRLTKRGIEGNKARDQAKIADIGKITDRDEAIKAASEAVEEAKLNLKGLERNAADAAKRLDEVDTFGNRNMWADGKAKIREANKELEDAKKRLDAGTASVEEFQKALDKVNFARVVTDKEITEALSVQREAVRNVGKSDRDLQMGKLFGQGNAPEKRKEMTELFRQEDVKKANIEAQNFNKTLTFQVATLGMNADKIKIIEMRHQRVSPAIIATTEAMQRLKKSMEMGKEANDMAKALKMEGIGDLMKAADVARFQKGDWSEGQGEAHLQRMIKMEEMRKKGFTEQQLKPFKEADKQKTEIEQYLKALEEGKKLTEEFLTPQQKFANEQQRLQKIFERGGFGKGAEAAQVYGKALAKAHEELLAMNNTINRVDALKFGGADALQAMQEFEAGKRVPNFGAPDVEIKEPPGVPHVKEERQLGLLEGIDAHLGKLVQLETDKAAKGWMGELIGGMGLGK